MNSSHLTNRQFLSRKRRFLICRFCALIQICVQKEFQFKPKCYHLESRQSTIWTPSEPSTKCYKLFFVKCALFWPRAIFTEVKSFDQQAISFKGKTFYDLSFLSSFSTNLNIYVFVDKKHAKNWKCFCVTECYKLWTFTVANITSFLVSCEHVDVLKTHLVTCH